VSFLDDESTQNSLQQTTLSDITEPVKKALVLADRIENGKALLDKLQKEYDDLTGNIIPGIMSQANCYDTTVADENGQRYKVSWKEDVRASIPKEDFEQRENALTFLRENQAEDIIKGNVEITLPPVEKVMIDGQEVEQREYFLSKLAEFAQMQDVSYSTKEDVHAATLAKWCREALALDGKSVASHTENELKAAGLSVFVYKKTSIKKV
jgi:hypothetical protein